MLTLIQKEHSDPRIFENLKTPLDYFHHHESSRPDATFLRQPYGNEWKTVSWSEAGDMARRMVTALREKYGLVAGDHVGILSKNCYHWIIADLAIMMGGFVSVPLYANLGKDQLQEVMPISDIKVIFLGKFDDWAHKVGGISDDIAAIRFPHYPGSAVVDRGDQWEDLIKQYQPCQDIHSPNLDDTWSIMFTSGTTGTPKGVMHTYRSCGILFRNEEINDILKSLSTPESRFFSFLPLNHIAERTAVELNALQAGATISFAESLDTFAKNLQDTQPTLFFAVPRIWTKFYQGVLSKMPQSRLDLLLRIPIISGMIKNKIKKGLGLSSAHTVLTGASMTPESLKQWYRSIGINLREVYGMTENFGGFSLMPADEHKPNTVGKPIINCAVKLDKETQEIRMYTPYTMTGYYKDPEKSTETLDGGWLRTGDMGAMTDDGFLQIVGRVKDTFKTSKGKFVVPAPIEKRFGKSEMIEQICLSGLGIPQPVALVNLSETAQTKDKDQVNNHLDGLLTEVNKELHGHERIAGLVVTKEMWTPDNAMLTPTLKIKRNAIYQKYGDNLRTWCECEDKIIWE